MGARIAASKARSRTRAANVSPALPSPAASAARATDPAVAARAATPARVRCPAMISHAARPRAAGTAIRRTAARPRGRGPSDPGISAAERTIGFHIIAAPTSAGPSCGAGGVRPRRGSMNVHEPRSIRNVVLVGHSGAGKTTLTEALLFTAGSITRMGRIEDGNTVSDHDPEEIRRGISVSLSLAPFEWDGVKVNLLDAPGYADFIGDVQGALRAADACLFVVSAVDGVEVQHEVVWELAAESRLPRAIFVNKLDRERASFDRTLEDLQKAFGTQVAPIQLPIGEEHEFAGIMDLLTRRAYRYDGGPQGVEGAWPEDLAAKAEPYREKLQD